MLPHNAGMVRTRFKAAPLRPRRAPRAARPWWRQVTSIMVALPLAAFTAVLVWPGPREAGGLDLPGPDREAASFAMCGAGARVNCVVDGDTFWYAGEKIRIADINTPEVGQPACAREARLGAAATARLHALLNQGPFTLQLIDRDRDQYGRLLRTVTRAGESLGAVLVDEGLAEEWRGYRGSWC